MSALPSRPAQATGVISELALARAQRNTVLIVDDLFSSRLLIAEIVRQIDPKLNLELFDTPSRALEYARQNRVDMVLTDFKLPEFDGIELVKQIRGLPHCVDIPIVVITVVDDRQVRYNALEGGATDFLIKPLDEHETRARCANLLDLRRHKIVLSDQARVLQYQVDRSVSEIHERELETLSKLAKAGEFRDKTTGNHLVRMAKYSGLIAQNLGLGGDMVHTIEVAAPMHDIGKIGIPDSVLMKEGPLSPAELEVMRSHPADRLRHPEGQPFEVPQHGLDHRARPPRKIRRHGVSERPARRRHSHRREGRRGCGRVRRARQRTAVQALVAAERRRRIPEVTAQQTLRREVRRRISGGQDEDRGDLYGAGGLTVSKGDLPVLYRSCDRFLAIRDCKLRANGIKVKLNRSSADSQFESDVFGR
jgi:two-component system response regulator RpfG